MAKPISSFPPTLPVASSRPSFARRGAAIALSAAALWGAAFPARADICQFNPTSGAWNVPSNWSNCTAGNGVPAGTPGPADRAEITGRTAILPAGVFSVGDLYLGAATIQGAGIGTTTLNVVAAGGIAWGSGFYKFDALTASISTSGSLPAISGPLIVHDAVLNLSGLVQFADATVDGAAAKIVSGPIANYISGGNITMANGGRFENNASFNVAAGAITIDGTFANAGTFNVSGGQTITLANAASFSNTLYIAGNGTIAAPGQILTLDGGYVEGPLVFNVGTLQNNGALIKPGPTPTPGIGDIVVNGNYVQRGGALQIDLAGTAPGQFDRLVVNGNVDFNYSTSSSKVEFQWSTPPAVGNFFDIVAFTGTRAGAIDIVGRPAGPDIAMSDVAGAYRATAVASPGALAINGSTNFPDTPVGSLSPVQTITLDNTGGSPVTVSSISLPATATFIDTRDGPAPNPSHYCGFGSDASGNPLSGGPIVINAGTGCSINFVFRPTATTGYSHVMTVTSDAPGSPHTATLTGKGVPPPAPAVTVSPTSLDFGAQPVGATSAPQSVIVTNSGTATVFFDSVTTAGPFASDYGSTTAAAPPALTMRARGGRLAASLKTGAAAIAAGAFYPPCAFSLSVGASCMVGVTFHPTAAGSATGTLTVNSNAPAATVALAGTGAGPNITLSFSPATIAVGGSASLVITLDNPFSGEFSITSGTVTTSAGLTLATTGVTTTCSTTPVVSAGTIGFSGGSIPGMTNCVIAVPVSSGVTGSYTASAAAGAFVTSMGANASASSATLAVTAAATPAVTLTPPGPLGFGAQTIATTSPAQTVTLTNGGSADLVIASITSSGDFGFTTSCPISTPPLSAGNSCPINIKFTPLTAAALTGSVTVTSNAPGSPHVISLNGVGVTTPVPGIALSPASLVFVGQALGTASAPQIVKVTNTGFATLNLTSVTVTGAGFARAPLAAADCGATLAPGGVCQIGIQFAPTALGTSTGLVTIVDNATGSPHKLTLSGTGVAQPQARIQVATGVAFGEQIVATSSAVRAVTIANTGTADLVIGGIALAGANAADFKFSGNCASVPPGGACELLMTFSPATVGAKSAELDIVSNSGGQAAALTVVAVSGTGIRAPRPVASLSLTALGFGNTIFGGAAGAQTVTLANSGGVPLAIQGLVVSGDFVQANNCAGTVDVAGSCTINVQFSPLGLGFRGGELLVYSNAEGSPHRVALNGTGCRWFSPSQSRFFLTTCGG